tara:strand:- start:120 stop:971 length:852 start_codon:yes stop_codon:yes gene_type:complete
MSRIRANTITNQNANGAPNFPDGLTVTGIVTATVSNSTLGTLSVTGNATVGGTLGVGGTLTYEDVTNIDSVGIITARSGINLTGGNITLGDSGGSSDDRIKLGASGDLEIYHSGSHSHITDAGTGGLKIRGSQVIIDDAAGDVMIQADQDGSVDLYHNGTKRIETTAAGVTVTGTVTDSKGNVRSIPLNSQSGAYTLVAADAGKVVYISTGGVTIPSSVMSAGDAVTIINDSGSNQTLTQGSGLSLYNTADATTGNRTLAGRGMATIYFPATATAYISGAGLS